MKAKEKLVSTSNKTEEYLEAIYRLEREKGFAKTMELVRRLNVVPGSITNTIERLERRGLVIHEPYKGVKLTEKGRKIALSVLRRHRLAERLLTDILHMDWSEVHDAACKLEHAITPDIVNALEKTLKHPQTCPHGNPIPPSQRGSSDEKLKRLTDLNPGQTGVVAKVPEEKPDLLLHFATLGLFPGTTVTVEEKAAFNAPLLINVKGTRYTLNQKQAIHIHIRQTEPPRSSTKRD